MTLPLPTGLLAILILNTETNDRAVEAAALVLMCLLKRTNDWAIVCEFLHSAKNPSTKRQFPYYYFPVLLIGYYV